MENHQKKSFFTFLKRTFNVKQWSDVDRLKGGGSYIRQLIFNLFLYRVATQVESFDQVIVRLQLTEEQILSRQRLFFRFALFFLILSLLLFAYSIYQLCYGTYLGVGLTLGLMLATLAFGFRYHFWQYQLRVRKLGCTLSEWWNQGVLGRKL